MNLVAWVAKGHIFDLSMYDRLRVIDMELVAGAGVVSLMVADRSDGRLPVNVLGVLTDPEIERVMGGVKDAIRMDSKAIDLKAVLREITDAEGAGLDRLMDKERLESVNGQQQSRTPRGLLPPDD